MRPENGIRRVGDRGLLLECADNADVHRVAAAARALHGGRLADVVPGHRTVLLAWAAPPVDAGLAAAVRDAAAAGWGDGGGPRAETTLAVPVAYDGPDLADVARLAGCSPEEVAQRHAAGRYRAAFVGFAPGFAYLLGLDPRLHVGRRDDPRERVPGGAVAVAGEYTAVYPAVSPGGWRLIGSTTLRMFDPARTPPALLEPGTAVRFEVAR